MPLIWPCFLSGILLCVVCLRVWVLVWSLQELQFTRWTCRSHLFHMMTSLRANGSGPVAVYNSCNHSATARAGSRLCTTVLPSHWTTFCVSVVVRLILATALCVCERFTDLLKLGSLFLRQCCKTLFGRILLLLVYPSCMSVHFSADCTINAAATR